MFDELRQDVWRNGGTDGEVELPVDGAFAFCHQFTDAVHFGTCFFGLTDNALARRRRDDRLVGAFKDADIQFFFQFDQHGTQRGLRYAQCLCCLGKVPVAVNGNDIFQLLKSHAIYYFGIYYLVIYWAKESL